MVDTFARLGTELKLYPENERTHHLRVAISQLNSLLFRRMLSKSCVSLDLNAGYYDHMSLNGPQPISSQQQAYNSRSDQYGTNSLSYNGESQNSYINDQIISQQQTQQQSYQQQQYSQVQSSSGFNNNDIPTQLLKSLPKCSAHSLHFPLQKCQENALKILRFVCDECEVMPSRDRVPYLVVAELLEQPYECKNHGLYSDEFMIDYHLNKHINPIIGQKHELNQMITNENDYLSDSCINLDELKEISSIETTPVTTDSSHSIASSNEKYEKFEAINSISGGSQNPFQSEQQSNQQQYDQTNQHQYQQSQPQHHYQEKAYQQSYQQDFRTSQSQYNQQPQQQQQYQQFSTNNNNYNNNQYQSSYQSSNIIPTRTPIIKPSFIKTQRWNEKKQMIKNSSPFSSLPGWNIKSFLVKSGDDLRKEMIAMQLIEYIQSVFQLENINLYLKPYQIISTGYQAGLIEFLENSKSIDRIKKSSNINPSTLKDYYEYTFGPSYSLIHATAVENFVKSLAGYSLVTYLLQVM